MYEEPNVFASIVPGVVSVPIGVPSYRACYVGPHFFVQNKAEVGMAYEGIALSAISYPNLPEQKNNAGSNLKVDISDTRFDPDLFIRRTNGVQVNISAVNGIAVGEDSITTIPANMYVDASGAAVQAPKASLSDGDMETAGVALWTGVASTITKDTVEEKTGVNCLKVITTNATNSNTSAGITVIPGELWKLKISLKGLGHDFSILINDVTNVAVISTTTFTGAAGYTDKVIEFTVPDGCTQITFLTKTGDTGDTYYVDDAHFIYNGSDALFGDLQVSYRALHDLYTGNFLAPLRADTVAEIIALYGADGLGPANPVGFAAAKGMAHMGYGVEMIAVGEPVDGVGAVAYTGALSNEATCYGASLDKAAEQEDIFSIVPLTFDRAVRDAFASHVATMSTLEGMKERIGIGADEVPTENIFRTGSDGVLYGKFTSDLAGVFADGAVITYAGNDYVIKVIDGVSYLPLPLVANASDITFTYDSTERADGTFVIEKATGFLLVLASASAGNWTLSGFRQVRAGDAAIVGSSTYSVTAIRSNGIVLGTYVADPASTVTQAGGISKSYTVKRYLTLDGLSGGIADKTAMATMLGDMAAAYGQENFMLVGPGWLRDSGYDFDVESFYYAAQIAAELAAPVDPGANGGFGQGAGYPIGVNSSTGLTESTTNNFRSSRYFTDTHMNVAANGGFAWIINDAPGGNVRLRHALTTLRTSNETAEVMLVAARYLGQKMIRDTMRPLLQKHRIGPGLAMALQPRQDGLAQQMVKKMGLFSYVNYDETVMDATDFTAVIITGEVGHIYPLNKMSFAMKTGAPVAFSVQL